MKVKGAALVKQATSHSWNPSIGYTFMPKWEGIPSAAAAVARSLRLAGVPYTYRNNGTTVTIEAQQPTPDDGDMTETPNGSWALQGNEITEDWRAHYAFLVLAESSREKILQCANREIDTKPSASGLTGNALIFYELAYNQVTTYNRSQYVLRHSQTVSNKYDQSLSGSNTLRVYTNAQLLSECAAFSEPLPAMLIEEIGKITPETAPDGYAWGWLKKPPVIQTAASDRIECAVEYWLYNWLTLFYPTVT